MFKKLILPIATLSGTIVGVGVFSLPYITLKVGLLPMLIYFLILGTLVILIHLFFGELALVTPDFKRLPGFAKFHLGALGGQIASISAILGGFGAILAYLIVGGRFLESLLSPTFGGNNLLYTISYFAFGAILIFFGIKIIAKIEFLALILFIFALLAIFFRSYSIIEIGNFMLFPVGSVSGIDTATLFLPYGAVLFSLWGASLIPEIEEMLGKNKKLLSKILVIATLIPIIIYLFFIYLILGITGVQTTESALTGLQDYLGNGIVVLALIFGLLATFTSFIVLGLTLKKIFWYDLKIGKNLSWALTCSVPLILFLAGVKSFIKVIGLVGGVMLGINGILILLMYQKFISNQAEGAKPKKIRFLILPLISIFVIGIFYEIFYFLR
ncbi:MAG: hypothetical protein KJI71_00710 [Patescibacteria group bacterium]|nr:hypothetical protein [Patescibacteria group bacterium]